MVKQGVSSKTENEVSGSRPRAAIVMTGGGARAAYQVGVLRCLGQRLENFDFPIITGVSAGAINAGFLASYQGSLAEAADALREVWEGITFENVFRVDLGWLSSNALRWAVRFGTGGSRIGPQVRGLTDTQPLRELLQKHLGTDRQVEGLTKNIETGRLDAIALATVNYGTGQTVTWVQGRNIETWNRPNRRCVNTDINVEHIMASSSLPLIFPAIEIDGAWYGDGGIRLAAPLSPPLHLGADRILAISTRYRRSTSEASQPTTAGYPPPAQIAGNLMNAIFLDVLDQDVERLERSNSFLRKVPPEDRGDYRPVDIVVVRPSRDLGKAAGEFEPDLPRGLRFLTRSLGTRETKSPDFLSLLMFQPEYLRFLIELGERDAEQRVDEVRELLEKPLERSDRLEAEER